MTDFERLHAQLDPFMESQRATLAGLISRHTGGNGTFASKVPALFLSNHDQCSQSFPTMMRPALCILANGSKRIRLGDEDYLYDPLNYMVVSVAMPLSGAILEASPASPCLSLRLDIDPAEINALIAAAGPLGVPARPTERGVYVEQLDPSLLDAVVRLVRLLDTPKDIAMLAPLVRREILYRLLRSPQGHRLYEIAVGNSQMHRVSQAIEWLNGHFHQPLRMEDLAREVNLSVSTLHHRFKAMTSMSPLQYQKQLRLQEARRLMLSEGLDACAAGYRVGYESASQFSREYSRLFGEPPGRDLQRLRMSV
ncbi:AraC family transcriptional regulator [Pseudomonas eucalypticola]|uniref:AraC family transcriptional regulator n=1 Tax=Pseudomonas eucalypticola TaxID=2599595 RepID=A0A7D5DC56_9PSED|nr:AraC family transcriptional regulator [Pseudomonas eucalypticola]QKZ06581.1 AraC family transcriptional regulator [Pseudomonas eucalypticola]